MATFRTRDSMEALRFVRSLVERGYTRDEWWPGKGGSVHKNSYRVTHHHRFYWVAYYEPCEFNARTETPEPKAKAPRKAYRRCTHPGCQRKHCAHGLCKHHVHRWYYHNNPEARARKLAKMAAKYRERVERKRMEEMKEAA